MGELPLEIGPEEVRAMLDAGERLRLIDVRQPEEFAFCRIEGSELLPMGSIPQSLQDLQNDDRPLIVLCHHGVRSLSAVHWLRRSGVPNCRSMAGGIDLWSLAIDPAVPRY